MALRLWDDAYSIGIAEIDQQHKEMFGTMLSLHRAMLAGDSGKQVGPALLELMRECEAHFRTEEALMAFHRFPELNNHRSEHNLMSGQLRVFLADHETGKPGLILDILDYLEDWQNIHVLQHDMKYRDYLLQQWGIQFKSRQPVDAPEMMKREKDGRRFPRLSCSIPVRLTSEMDAPIVYAKCVNISRTGAFLKTWSPLGLNTTATARFHVAESSVEIRVAIRRAEPCVGMGISFLGPLPHPLEQFIGQLQDAHARAQCDPTEITCERLLHACIQNLSAFEDVVLESGFTKETATAVRALYARAQRLERLAAHEI